MSDTVRAHDYIDGKCQHCGDKESDNEGKDRSCIARYLPRAKPASIFAEIDPIFNHIQELRRERDQQLAATTTLDM